MKTPEQFEQRLASQPQRPVPASWRQEILSAARAAAGCSSSQPSRRPRLLTTLQSQLRAFLWPQPGAWAALAAVWLLLLTVNLAMRDPAAPRFAGQNAPPSSQMLQMLRQQQLMLTELVGQGENPEADQPKPAAPRPRSQRHSDFINA
jgi:hypothetical protein